MQVAVTIYNGESGLFLQKGPAGAAGDGRQPETIGDVVRQGDSVCIAQWEAQTYAQDGPPFQAQCQRVVAGRTINVYATPGLTIEQTADLVDDVPPRPTSTEAGLSWSRSALQRGLLAQPVSFSGLRIA